MDPRQIARVIVGVAVIIGFSGCGLVANSPTSGGPKTMTVDCNAGGSIAGAIAGLKSGDTLTVNGACKEAVTIPAGLDNVTLDGQKKATITVADTAPNVISVVGREVTIKGFTIDGGRNGIGVFRGASAVIDGNTIQNAGKGRQPGSGLGINVARRSFAGIVNNTIVNNLSIGILVHENSSARIGFIDVAATGAPNTIQNNGGDGISVSRAASARVVKAVITNNKGDGIHVERDSHVEAADNTISGNGRNGISATGGSGVDIEIGSATVVTPNKTDSAAKNQGFGIKCAVGGYVQGRLGTLTGTAGATNYDHGCVNGLKAAE